MVLTMAMPVISAEKKITCYESASFSIAGDFNETFKNTRLDLEL